MKEKSRAYYSRLLYQLLVKRALSILNHYRLKLGKDIEADDLIELLSDEVDTLCSDHEIPLTNPYEVAMGSADSVGVSDPDRTVRKAVEYALEAWHPEVYRGIQQRAREAGRKGKKYTLADHLTTAHLNVTAAARALGISRPTVYAMRKEYADLDSDMGEIHESATGTAEADSVRDRARAETRNEPQHMGDHDTGSGSGQNPRLDPAPADRETWLENLTLPY